VIDECLRAQCIDQLIMSTNCDEIKKIAGDRGCDVWHRDGKWVTDAVTGYEVMMENMRLWRERNASVKDMRAFLVEGNTVILEPGRYDRVAQISDENPTATRIACMVEPQAYHPLFSRSIDRSGEDGYGTTVPYVGHEFEMRPTTQMPEPCFECSHVNLCTTGDLDRLHDYVIGVPIEPGSFVHIHTLFDVEFANFLWEWHHHR
jgi:hypothetical protein